MAITYLVPIKSGSFQDGATRVLIAPPEASILTFQVQTNLEFPGSAVLQMLFLEAIGGGRYYYQDGEVHTLKLHPRVSIEYSASFVAPADNFSSVYTWFKEVEACK